MEKLTAKLHAFGKVYEGTVVKMGRKRVLIAWTSSTGKKRETWYTPTKDEADLEGPEGQGKCWLQQPVTAKKAAPKLEQDPDALPLKKVAPVTEYPEGSHRARRQELLAQERELRATLKDCPNCKMIRDRANALVNEADRLTMACVEERQSEQGAPKVRRIVSKPKGEPDAGE